MRQNRDFVDPERTCQQCLVGIVEKFLTTTAPSCTIDPIIGQSVISTPCVLLKCNAKSTTSTSDPEWTAVGYDDSSDDNILPVGQQQRRWRKLSHHGAAQQNAELVSASPLTEVASPHIINTARTSSNTEPFDDAQDDFLPVGFISKAPFEDGVSLAWVRTIKVSIDLQVAWRKKSY